MKYLFILIALAVVGGCAYAYSQNPQGCTKLGTDLAAKWPALQTDVVTIFTKTPDDMDTSYADTLAESKRTGRNMLLIFDGSAWCPACQLLDKEVIPTPEWTAFAGKSFVTTSLEVPKFHPDDDAEKTPNQRLADKYGVHGYPTLLVVDSNEKELKRFEGYGPGIGANQIIETFRPFAK